MLLEINFTLVLFAISFLIFIYLLNLALYKPVGEIIEKRKSIIDVDYLKAKDLTQEANNLLENYKTRIKEAKKGAQELIQNEINEAQRKKETEINHLLISLNQEKEKAIILIKEEQNAVINQLEKEITTLSELITDTILGGNKTLVSSH